MASMERMHSSSIFDRPPEQVEVRHVLVRWLKSHNETTDEIVFASFLDAPLMEYHGVASCVPLNVGRKLVGIRLTELLDIFFCVIPGTFL